MREPTAKQQEIIKRLAYRGWDVVTGGEIRSAQRCPYLHVEVDWEAGDPEHGYVVKVARLTAEGAAWYEEATGRRLECNDDQSWEHED